MGKIHSRVPLVLAALLVAVLVLSAWQPSFTGQAVAVTCLDKDGDNPLVAGETVTTTSGRTTQEFLDKCVQNKVLEYTCSGNKLSKKTYNCPCRKGACYINLGRIV